MIGICYLQKIIIKDYAEVSHFEGHQEWKKVFFISKRQTPELGVDNFGESRRV